MWNFAFFSLCNERTWCWIESLFMAKIYWVVSPESYEQAVGSPCCLKHVHIIEVGLASECHHRHTHIRRRVWKACVRFNVCIIDWLPSDGRILPTSCRFQSRGNPVLLRLRNVTMIVCSFIYVRIEPRDWLRVQDSSSLCKRAYRLFHHGLT